MFVFFVIISLVINSIKTKLDIFIITNAFRRGKDDGKKVLWGWSQAHEGDDDQGEQGEDLQYSFEKQQIRIPEFRPRPGDPGPEPGRLVFRRQRQELRQVKDERDEEESDGVEKLAPGVKTGRVRL